MVSTLDSRSHGAGSSPSKELGQSKFPSFPHKKQSCVQLMYWQLSVLEQSLGVAVVGPCRYFVINNA